MRPTEFRSTSVPGPSPRRRGAVLLAAILLVGLALTVWKISDLQAGAASATGAPEPAETVTAAVAGERRHHATTTAIGTVRALQWVTLRNELAGTVRSVRLTPGQVVERGTVLVALDVSVEEAALRAQRAQADLAETVLRRTRSLADAGAVSREELDRAQAERDVAMAEIARLQAIIARKTIRAPFRARVGIADVHPGQYLGEGTELTTLQGVEEAVHVDFAVPQTVAAALRVNQAVEVFVGADSAPLAAKVVAVDARVNPATRNAQVRARLADGDAVAAPGGSVRVSVPTGPDRRAVVVPVSALRKGPGGDHVFVLAADSAGATRAALREVRAGEVVGDEVVILDGLAAGDRVATSGSFKLRDGALVQVGAPGASGATPVAVKGAE
jgi:membrane fusion protein (multidrug efflux system)